MSHGTVPIPQGATIEEEGGVPIPQGAQVGGAPASTQPAAQPPETFMSETSRQLHSAALGLRKLIADPNPFGSVGMALLDTMRGVGNELSGKPQEGKSALTAPTSLLDRVVGAGDLLLGGDPASARAHAQAGQHGAAAADLGAVPITSLLLGGLLTKDFPVPESEVAARQSRKLTRAIGTSASTDIPGAIRTALPELETTARLSGGPKDLAGLEKTVQDTLTRTENDFNQRLQPIAFQQTVPNPIAQDILSHITPNLAQTPGGRALASALQRAAVDFQRPWTLQQLNLERMAATKRLRSVANQSPSSQAAAMKLNAAAIVDKAVENGAKDIVYGALDRRYAGQVPAGYFEKLKQSQSALIDLKDQLAKRSVWMSNEEAKGPFERARAHLYASTGGHIGGAIGGLSELIAPEHRAVQKAARTGLKRPKPRIGKAAVGAALAGRRLEPSLAPDEPSDEDEAPEQ